MKTLQISKNHGTWVDLSSTQKRYDSNEFPVRDEDFVLTLSPELIDVVKFARHNDYTHINLVLSNDPLYVMSDFPLVQDTEIHLTKERALEVVEMISQSNYQLARFGESLFDNKEEAIAFIESDEYREDEGIEVAFLRANEETDSTTASYKNNRWYLVDIAHGGTTTSHVRLEAALRRLRDGLEKGDEYRPELFEINL